MGRPWSDETSITAVWSGFKLQREGRNDHKPCGRNTHRGTPKSVVELASSPLILLIFPVDFLSLLLLRTPTPELTVHTSSVRDLGWVLCQRGL